MRRTKLSLGRLMAAGTVAAIAALSAQPASAAEIILDAWQLNLDTINDEGVFTGLSDATNIDHINVVGSETTVEQTVVGGSALGQPFEESGKLQWTNFSPEGGGAVTNFSLGTASTLYVAFTGLTGVLNADETITFDAGSGQVILYLDSDNDLDPTTGTVQQIAEFALLDPSGGSDLDFFGGTADNATVDITLDLISVIDDDLFLDEDGNPLDAVSLTLHLVNTDSLLDPNFDPNPDNSGVDADGNGVSLIHVQNNGQWNIAQIVPEPSTIGLLAFGLSALGFFMRRRRS